MVSDCDSTKDARARVDVNIVSDLRFAGLLPRAQRYIVKNQAIFADFNAVTDHDVGGMVELQAGANAWSSASSPEVDVAAAKWELDEAIQYPHRNPQENIGQSISPISKPEYCNNPESRVCIPPANILIFHHVTPQIIKHQILSSKVQAGISVSLYSSCRSLRN
jgi:hypothetical protein